MADQVSRAGTGQSEGADLHRSPRRDKSVSLREFLAWMAVVYLLGFIGYGLQLAGVL